LVEFYTELEDDYARRVRDLHAGDGPLLERNINGRKLPSKGTMVAK
jgi:hypothetical protein